MVCHDASSLSPSLPSAHPAEAYQGVWRVIVVVQFVFWMIGSEDDPSRDVPLVIACALHWMMAAYIYYRRPNAPTKFDLFMVRFGVIPFRMVLGVLGWWLPMRI